MATLSDHLFGDSGDEQSSASPSVPTDMEVVVRDEEVGDESVSIPCHRVILAARCPYFRRALLSGMREDIER